MSNVIYESIDGKQGVRIERENEHTMQLLTMRNGFQWAGMPVNRELLLALHAAIESALPDDFAAADAKPAEITPKQAMAALDDVIPSHLRATRHGEGFMGERYATLKAFIEQPRTVVGARGVLRRIWLEAGGNPDITEPTEREVLDCVYGLNKLADEAIEQEEGQAATGMPANPPTDAKLQALFRDHFGRERVFSESHLAYARALSELARNVGVGVGDLAMEALFHRHIGNSLEFTGPQRAFAREVSEIACGVSKKQPLDWSRTDRELGRQVWRFIDRMNDLTDEDNADKVLEEFRAAVNPIFDEAIRAKGFRG